MSNIHIQYYYSSDKKTLLDTEIVIPVDYWDKSTLVITPDLPPQFGGAKRLNKALQVQMRLVENIISYAVKKKIENTGDFVKKFYSPDLDIYSLDGLVKQEADKKIAEEKAMAEAIRQDVFKQIDAFVTSKEKKLCKDFPRLFKNLKDHLYAYEQARNIKITFDSFTLNFYEDFVDFLSHEYVQPRRKTIVVGFKINTVGKTIHQLRRFLNNRIKKKIIAPIDLSEWEVVGEQTDAVYLSFDEIEKVRNVDLSAHPHLLPYRDDFVLGCLTALRFSDFSTLEKPDVRGDYLYKKKEKSGHWVVIPLKDAARVILEKRFNSNYTPLTNVTESIDCSFFVLVCLNFR